MAVREKQPLIDFEGFQFGNFHSSQFGLKCTSNNGRYVGPVLAATQDNSVKAPGQDGAYYFGADYVPVTIGISFAFDNLSEELFMDLKRWLQGKTLRPLILDERPYCYYMVKLNGELQMSYMCFDETHTVAPVYEYTAAEEYVLHNHNLGELAENQPDNVGEEYTARVYKGEGQVSFISYSPFAMSRYKFLDEFSIDDFPNKNLWAPSTRMLETQEDIDVFYNGIAKLYNPGDEPTPFSIGFHLPTADHIDLKLLENEAAIATLELSNVVAQGEDDTIVINTYTGLVEGGQFINNSFVRSGNIYNNYITVGDFFTIPVSEIDTEHKLETNVTPILFEYNYLYY